MTPVGSAVFLAKEFVTLGVKIHVRTFTPWNAKKVDNEISGRKHIIACGIPSKRPV